ncbi:MAG: PLP-dependent aspartate aminotransferase family protein, partial [Clostridiales bacterium]|nr:PLP-dependent aspartate aminotransferase family protein [Clostridiales bacterium]
MKPETACIHAQRDSSGNTGSVTVPIYQSATFAHPGLGQTTGYDYTRLQNPTREHVEKLLAALEGGVDALAFSSGMAAITAIFDMFSPCDEIIATDDLYGGSIRLFSLISKRNGLFVKYVNSSDLSVLESAITNNTKAVFIENPTNPLMNVTDIAAVRELTADKNILLIVDNTFLTPYFCNPLQLGADIAVHSGTKYLAGHNDTLAGFVVCKTPEYSEKLRYIQKTTGAVLSPFDSFLTTRGIKTLALRMEKSQRNAIKIAAWLQKHPKVTRVFYAGLPEHPAYEISKRQGRGFGAMISFSVDCTRTVQNLLNNIQLILFAESLGGVETLITY